MDPATEIQQANESLALCSKVITELKKFAEAKEAFKSLMKNADRVRQSTEILLTVIPEVSKAGYGDLSIMLRPCAERLPPLFEDILARASGMIAGQPRQGIVRRLRWTLIETQTKDLVDSMKRVQERIHNNVNLLTGWASLRNLPIAQQAQDAERRLASKPGIQDAFSIDEWNILYRRNNPRRAVVDDFMIGPARPGAVDEFFGANVDEDQTMQGPQRPTLWTWLGYIITTGHDAEYLGHRAALSEAAYYDRWKEVFRIIEVGNTLYGKSWVNATPIWEPTNLHDRSLWAPIHQAVYWRAPLEVFERLVTLGGSRTLRTDTTDFASPNMSALELALEYDLHWAIDILRPIIYLPVPQTTLQTLQDKFHASILRELEGTGVNGALLHLPILEVLTEYESGSTWFPIMLEAGRKSGYVYCIDSRHLLVWSVKITGPESSTKYRITEDDIFEVDEALVFPPLPSLP